MKKLRFRNVLKTINNYVVFFLTVAFAVSCCMMLFVSTLADSMGLVFTQENIGVAAKVTFLNVLLLTLLFGTIDHIRRKIMVDRPVQIITQATEQIMQGDFSVRVRPMHGAGMEGFNQIGKAINAVAKELSGTETLRTDFIANVSHELKTPLAVMANLSTMLQQPGLSDAERMAYAKDISHSARRLAALITNILKLNKLENQQIFPQPQEFDLGEQLCQCLLQFENVWEKKNIEIETDIAQDIKVEADELFGESDYMDGDMIVLPGGMPGTLHLKNHEALRKVLFAYKDAGKYLAAICAAPSVYGWNGMLEGKKATCYPGFEEELKGATATGEGVVTDGQFITSKGLGTAIDFSLELITLLDRAETAENIAKAVQYR